MQKEGPVRRLPALFALLVPVGAGLAYLWTAGAPQHYLAVNAGAFALGALWILFGRGPRTAQGSRILVAILLAICFAPLVTGPWVNGIARWLPIGGFALHAGAFSFPAIAVLAARDRDYAPPILLAVLLTASIQPDAALGFAAVFAAIGLHDQTRDWRIGLVCIIGFAAALIMVLEGELPPQPFVERIIADAMKTSIAWATGLLVSLAVGMALMLFGAPFDNRARFALAGAFFGFSITALMSHYPSILIGYGASPILGFGLALGLAMPSEKETSS